MVLALIVLLSVALAASLVLYVRWNGRRATRHLAWIAEPYGLGLTARTNAAGVSVSPSVNGVYRGREVTVRNGIEGEQTLSDHASRLRAGLPDTRSGWALLGLQDDVACAYVAVTCANPAGLAFRVVPGVPTGPEGEVDFDRSFSVEAAEGRGDLARAVLAETVRRELARTITSQWAHPFATLTLAENTLLYLERGWIVNAATAERVGRMIFSLCDVADAVDALRVPAGTVPAGPDPAVVLGPPADTAPAASPRPLSQGPADAPAGLPLEHAGDPAGTPDPERGRLVDEWLDRIDRGDQLILRTSPIGPRGLVAGRLAGLYVASANEEDGFWMSDADAAARDELRRRLAAYEPGRDLRVSWNENRTGAADPFESETHALSYSGSGSGGTSEASVARQWDGWYLRTFVLNNDWDPLGSYDPVTETERIDAAAARAWVVEKTRAKGAPTPRGWSMDPFPAVVQRFDPVGAVRERVVRRPELAERIRRHIHELRVDGPPLWHKRRSREELNGLPIDGAQLDLWAIRPDGVVFWQDLDSSRASFDEVRDPERVRAALLQGAKWYPDLEGLVPPPADADECHRCRGTGWARIPGVPEWEATADGAPRQPCTECNGWGWT
jgi:hypothetical protein